MPSIVRDFKPDDVTGVMRLIKEFEAETSAAKKIGGVNENFFGGYLMKCWASGIVKILVLEDNKKIVGSLAVMVGIDPFNGKLFLSELFWFVTKEARGYANSMTMLEMMEKFAKLSGCRYISMFHLSDVKAEKMKRFYEKIGYTHTQNMYIKEFD